MSYKFTKEEQNLIDWIDNSSYESLLSKWRNSTVGSLFFQGEVGKYYSEKMAEKRQEVGNAEHVRASKSIGW